MGKLRTNAGDVQFGCKRGLGSALMFPTSQTDSPRRLFLTAQISMTKIRGSAVAVQEGCDSRMGDWRMKDNVNLQEGENDLARIDLANACVDGQDNRHDDDEWRNWRVDDSDLTVSTNERKRPSTKQRG